MSERSERAPRRRPTSTSAFGASRREGHDASAFYERFTPPVLSPAADIEPDKAVDQLFAHDARQMPELKDDSVALVVTSPPYFAGKEYEQALGEGHIPANYVDYLRMLEDVFSECVRVLEPGGRIAVNVANLGRKPYRSLAADVIAILQDRLRLLLRGEVVWVKAQGATGSCAWGSFASPTNPVLRDLTERVVIASKGRFDRALTASRRESAGLPSEPTVSTDEFLASTLDVWEIPPESATRVGHPAPFPVALVERLIHLHTWAGDLVLDPFMGSGSTAVAAVATGRHYVGYDTDAGYLAMARERVAQTEPVAAAPRGTADATARAVLRDAGFTIATKAHKVAGITPDIEATDRAGNVWRFDVAGGFTVVPTGLSRSDEMWRALGRAAVFQTADPAVPYVVLTTDRPPLKSPLDVTLRSAVGEGRPVRAVVVLDAADPERALEARAALVQLCG